MRAGFNPTRRNRNIGTSRSGFRRQSSFCIPERHGFSFFELGDVAALIPATSNSPAVIVESARPCFFFAFTPEDVQAVFAKLPKGDTQGITAAVLHQPSAKEHLLCPVWGRLSFYARLRALPSLAGPTILLNAVGDRPMKWSKSLQRPEVNELQRLAREGHNIRENRKSFIIESSPEAARNTQLYRTLPHEVGHWVDYCRFSDPEEYWRRPTAEREEFAERYAERVRGALQADPAT